MADIRINLARANQQAQRLNEEASVLKQRLNELNAEIQNIPSYWEGDASTAFLKKLKEQHADIAEQCRNLEMVATDIRTVAERIKAQEEAAQRAANAL